jgi:Spy/CpxP family protein refolding chaperone
MIPSSRFSALVLLLGALSIGALVGGIAVSAAEHRGGFARHRPRGGGYVERLRDELSLTAAQQESVKAILDRHEPGMDSLWSQVRPQFDSLRSALRTAIRAQLAPDQQEKYTAMVEQREREYRERRANARR